MIKKILKRWYILIGPIIFIIIIKDIDFSSLRKIFLEINLIYYAMAFSLYLPIAFLRSYRWKKIMDAQKIHYSVKDAFLMYSSSSLLGLITPGKIGDFSKMVYLKKDDHSMTQAFLGNFLDKLFDLLFSTIFVFIAIFFLPFIPNFSLDYVALIKWGGLMAITVSFILFWVYKNNKEKLINFIREIIIDIKRIKAMQVSYIFTITAVNWFIYFILIYFTALSIGMAQYTTFFYLSFTGACGVLIGLLPVSTLNIGTREAIFIFLLTPVGVPKEMIISFSLLVLLNYLCLFLIGWYGWTKKPVFGNLT